MSDVTNYEDDDDIVDPAEYLEENKMVWFGRFLYCVGAVVILGAFIEAIHTENDWAALGIGFAFAAYLYWIFT